MATNAQIFSVRLLIKDPMGFNSIIEVANVASLPSTPIAQALYFVTDIAEYQSYEDSAWIRQDIIVSNARISTLYDLYSNENKVAAKMVNDLISHYGQQLALAYKKHDDGSESFEKNTLSDIVSFYKSLKIAFEEEASETVGMNTGRYVKTKKPVIGGML